MSNERSSLRTFDLVLLVGGGIIAALVAFAVLHFVVGAVWFVLKFVFVAAVVVLVAKWLIGRRR